MALYVEFSNDDGGGRIVAEMSEDEAGVIPVGLNPGAVARRAAVGIDEALSQIREVADAALRNVRQISSTPDEVRIEFGVKLTAEVGAVVARTGGEAQFLVSLTWQRDDR